MDKYVKDQTVGAVYDSAPAGNPFLAAMPDLLPPARFLKQIGSSPPLPQELPAMTLEERRRLLPSLSSLFVPLDYMYAIYDTLYRAIATTYTTRTMIDGIRQINAIFAGRELQSYATQADSGSILGVPGIGKTSTIRRCLSVMPQTIEHTEYQGQPFYRKQVLYLLAECPSDCSVKTLGYNIITALDRAIGSGYMDSLSALRSSSASAIATQVKILCMTHHVGLIIVDEIQNAVVTARKNRQVKPLIKFLVELTNDTSTAVYFVGTPLAEELFIAQEHLKRRTRGIRLLPLRPDGTYREFLQSIWPYQYTPQSAALTDKLANKLYDHSGGIPAYIIKIFQESQAQALIQGRSSIDEKIMQRAIDILAIKVPKTYSGGTHISDFEIGKELPEVPPEPQEVPRQYANKRGRRATQRDEADLLVAFRKSRGAQEMIKFLEIHNMLERMGNE